MPQPAGRVPYVRAVFGAGRAARRGQGAAGHFRRPAVGQGRQGARAPRRRAADGRPGGRRRCQWRRHRRPRPEQPAGWTLTSRCGRRASKPRLWPTNWPMRAALEVDRAGRIPVLPDCSLPGHPEVFVVGDMMALNNLPGVAEVAMQGGLHAAKPSRHGLARQGRSRPRGRRFRRGDQAQSAQRRRHPEPRQCETRPGPISTTLSPTTARR